MISSCFSKLFYWRNFSYIFMTKWILFPWTRQSSMPLHFIRLHQSLSDVYRFVWQADLSVAIRNDGLLFSWAQRKLIFFHRLFQINQKLLIAADARRRFQFIQTRKYISIENCDHISYIVLHLCLNRGGKDSNDKKTRAIERNSKKKHAWYYISISMHYLWRIDNQLSIL